MSSPDKELIERLRKENLDQFVTLVRMHLSFVVDINTDDVDCSTDKPKQFRWNFHKKTKNSSQSNTKNTTDTNSMTEEGILRLNELIDFLSKPENVVQEGIFRRTGSLSRQQELRNLLLTGSDLQLDEGKFSVHDCASVLKGFLSDLSQPLLMDQYYQTYCTLAAQYPPNAESSQDKLLIALQLLLLLLTPNHRDFLERLLILLRLVADNEASNRMSPDTLATMFTPHLLCPRKLPPAALRCEAVALAPLVSYMVREAPRLFEAPRPLATDAAAYFTRCDRVCDKTAASTVYTFVDQRRTRAENAANPTDAALAQLYAHIHALPDSTHKRRLVKHFNRHNAYGTPIQIQRTGKVAGSRSLGDSIKRHIFNKGLLNKTPKKGSGSINTINEKTSKCKRFMDGKTDVSHKNIVLKNLASKMNSESLDNNDYNSDCSNESTLSDGALSMSAKASPKFASEPNLNALACEDAETPKNTKKRLFRSKLTSNQNKRYYKRSAIRSTPTCVSCVDDQDTDSDMSYHDAGEDLKSSIDETPKQLSDDELDFKKHYLTSTPGFSEAFLLDEDRSSPCVVNFRRASMSPITKSTQKLSKAMQESIMTPRSRKPLVVTCERRDSLTETNEQANEQANDSLTETKEQANDSLTETNEQANEQATQSNSELALRFVSPRNDSDFVSSDDEISHSSPSRRPNNSNVSVAKRNLLSDGRSMSSCEVSPLRSANTHFIISHERPNLIDDLNTTLRDEVLLPDFKLSHEITNFPDKAISLTEPFREYLKSRSVLTATPVDLSMLNKSNDADEKMTDSLMYCLDGNVPIDLTSSISNLAVDKDSTTRSPLKNLNNIDKSPNRKRVADATRDIDTDSKKVLVEKENLKKPYDIRETEL